MTRKPEPTAALDPIIHPVTRLSICGLLAAGADWVEFAALRDAARVSDSVLSKQSRLLEVAGYVEVRKGAVGRRPRTWFRLTPDGRQALRAHVAWLQQVAQVRPEAAADDPDKPIRRPSARSSGVPDEPRRSTKPRHGAKRPRY